MTFVIQRTAIKPMGAEDEWDCGTGTGESGGVEGLFQDLLGPDSSAALERGSPSELHVVVPSVVDSPPRLVGKKRKLPAGLAPVPKAKRVSGGAGRRAVVQRSPIKLRGRGGQAP
jgi:hypothetical protein